MLDRAIRLTVYAHEWYWDAVWTDVLVDGIRYSRKLPRVYLLHQFYRQYQEQLQEFEGYANWEAVVRKLGCPVSWRGTLEPYLKWDNRYRMVRECFTDNTKKVRKRRWWWSPRVGGKWQKKWAPTPEVAEEKRVVREHKQEWRDTLGKNKDCSKRWSRGPRRYYKRARSQNHRAWTKHHLRNGSWESLHQRDREQFFGYYTWS
jgi:hypothetical protein